MPLPPPAPAKPPGTQPQPPAPKALPAVTRIDYDALAKDVVPEKKGDPSYKGQVEAEAVRLEPLRQIQANFDQTVQHAQAIRRGEPWLFPGGFALHVKDAVAFAERRRDVLAVAHAKADAAIAFIKSQIQSLEGAMQPPPADTPEPTQHPLVDAGYDRDADPNIDVTESATAALKAGHATPAMAEALAKVDVPAGEERAKKRAEADKAAGKPPAATVGNATPVDGTPPPPKK